MTLFFSVKFKNHSSRFIGEVEFPLNTFQFSEEYKPAMIAYCRRGLTNQLSKWGIEADQVIQAEFFFHRGSEEVMFFEWSK
jgi:hypothetical protein